MKSKYVEANSFHNIWFRQYKNIPFIMELLLQSPGHTKMLSVAPSESGSPIKHHQILGCSPLPLESDSSFFLSQAKNLTK